MKYKLLIFTICFFSLTNIRAELKGNSLTSNFNHIKAIVIENSKLMEKPILGDHVISVITQNSIIDIIDVNNKKAIVDGLGNLWYRVKFNENVGWVFGSTLYVFDDTIKIKKVNKTNILFNKWQSIINSKNKFQKGMRFIESTHEVPFYKDKIEISKKRKQGNLKEDLLFKVLNITFDKGDYENSKYLQFHHPKYGLIWVLGNDVNFVADGKIFEDYRIVLCASEPIIEGDMNRYDLIIYKKNVIVFAIKDFKDVGPYASAEIKRIYYEDNELHIELFCEGNDTDSCRFSNEKVDSIVNFTNIIYDYIENKITRIYEYDIELDNQMVLL